MKIKANVLANFLEKVSLSGIIPTALLEFKDDGMTVNIQSASIVVCSGFLAKESFVEYEKDVNDLGIKNIIMLLNILKRYNDNIIELKVVENKLLFVSETGSSYFVLCDKKMVDNFTVKIPNLDDLTEFFELNVNKLMSIKSASDILKVDLINIKSTGKQLIFSVENDTGDKITEEIDIDYEVSYSSYGNFLQRIINVLSGNVLIGFKENYPIKIIENNDNLKITYILAPLNIQ